LSYRPVWMCRRTSDGPGRLWQRSVDRKALLRGNFRNRMSPRWTGEARTAGRGPISTREEAAAGWILRDSMIALVGSERTRVLSSGAKGGRSQRNVLLSWRGISVL